jgi:predicted ArsR family transcriptional regulator
MVQNLQNQRFFTTTRGRIVALLCRAGYTVEELARTLGLTDNAVRAHLTVLERDGIVVQSGLRRGSGKPACVYSLAPGADQLFPRAYLPTLQVLLAVLDERLSAEEFAGLLRELGRRIASRWGPPAADLTTRLRRAVEALNELGALAELEVMTREPVEFGTAYRIRAATCPLAALVAAHPQICSLIEALLADLLGLPVERQCACEAVPRCCFEVHGDSGG